MSMDRDLLDTAVEMARQAGQITLEYFRSDRLGTTTKADGTPVTLADTAAESHLRAALRDAFPDDAIKGEEEDDEPGTSGRCWYIDPIDGTAAFTRGVPTYSNLIALIDEDGPAIGVIHLPAMGETVAAGRGLGCELNKAPCSVSGTAELDTDAYFTSTGYEDFSPDQLAAVHRSGMKMRTWGDAYGYALVATGRCDVMFDPIVSEWDVAPMPIILSEAGGRFTGLDQSDGFSAGTGLATNGVLHPAALDLLHP